MSQNNNFNIEPVSGYFISKQNFLLPFLKIIPSKFRYQFLIHCSFLFLSFSSAGQSSGSRTVSITLPTIAILDIHPKGNITLNFTAPTEAGSPLTNPSNNSKWLNYTSAITAGGSSRSISASINNTIPGMNIRLQASAAMGLGGGIRGTSAGLVTLTTTPTTFISGIGGAYTGDGVNNGHQLTISVVPSSSYGSISAQTSTSIVVTYTISSI